MWSSNALMTKASRRITISNEFQRTSLRSRSFWCDLWSSGHKSTRETKAERAKYEQDPRSVRFWAFNESLLINADPTGLYKTIMPLSRVRSRTQISLLPFVSFSHKVQDSVRTVFSGVSSFDLYLLCMSTVFIQWPCLKRSIKTWLRHHGRILKIPQQ